MIKTSSMGDVIHALPVVTDILAARPGARIDWVVEEGFAQLPRLHPGVGEVIPVAIRRWRRALGQAATWSEIRATRARLRAGAYDLALDLQGLIKSAMVARWTGAPIAGFSRASAREPLAALAYAHRYDVPADLHAIERLRSLAAQALGYRAEGGPRFALSAPALDLAWRPRGSYAVFLHATSRAEKQWPAERWVELGRALLGRGVSVVLPWGGQAEQAAAQALAAGIGAAAMGEAAPLVRVAPRLSLSECARLLADARAVVGVDTGLTHLSAALDSRTVALFAATPAWRFGPYWTPRARNLGEDGTWPQAGEVLAALKALGSFV
ncbi:lipopolysaccharide heptosyltransferase I [Quisquiliibacterium transsilvanicum]|uniref:Lipopolysaccharide heptosyltransferase 1 n=1 Tax=Quisquiliibacterium transsilvanicum TaxID=1549638 RepID=A0A7W8HK24_9BURK|nr:lipopolysaccharide heptosyltransferase I [Quisquiliibacterium transsilvanicum]MBB5273511.1 heptosyltransferase-1 [Quisquiliibacterium transsilvanicum]